MEKTLEQLFFETLNEKQKRLFAALKANELGYYGGEQVSQELGIHRHTIRAGQKELLEMADGAPVSTRIRKLGGGRKKTLPPTRT